MMLKRVMRSVFEAKTIVKHFVKKFQALWVVTATISCMIFVNDAQYPLDGQERPTNPKRQGQITLNLMRKLCLDLNILVSMRSKLLLLEISVPEKSSILTIASCISSSFIDISIKEKCSRITLSAFIRSSSGIDQK